MIDAEETFFNLKFIIKVPDKEDESEISWEKNFSEKIIFDGQEFALSKPLCVGAQSRWVDDGSLAVNISIETQVEGSCVRCLEKAELAISEKLLYLYSSRGFEEEKDELLVKVKVFGKTLDIVGQVWESLLLLLPRRILCSKDCKGLCPSCGANLN